MTGPPWLMRFPVPVLDPLWPATREGMTPPMWPAGWLGDGEAEAATGATSAAAATVETAATSSLRVEIRMFAPSE